MNSRQKKNAGCWTCRLRRKKCDYVRPVCGICAALEIRCYSDQPKPEWMDNGAKQREMVDQLKAEVKKNASRRRSRRLIQRAVRDLDDQEESETRVPEVDITLSPRAQGTNERNPDEDKYWTPNYSGDATSDFTAAHLVSGSPGFAQIPLDHSTSPTPIACLNLFV